MNFKNLPDDIFKFNIKPYLIPDTSIDNKNRYINELFQKISSLKFKPDFVNIQFKIYDSVIICTYSLNRYEFIEIIIKLLDKKSLILDCLLKYDFIKLKTCIDPYFNLISNNIIENNDIFINKFFKFSKLFAFNIEKNLYNLAKCKFVDRNYCMNISIFNDYALDDKILQIFQNIFEQINFRDLLPY